MKFRILDLAFITCIAALIFNSWRLDQRLREEMEESTRLYKEVRVNIMDTKWFIYRTKLAADKADQEHSLRLDIHSAQIGERLKREVQH